MTTTTSVRFDDVTFADIQRRFREGRPAETAKRRRYSRCDLILSLHTEIESLIVEGYSVEGIAAYFGTLDVIIPVATLKNYIGRARRKPGVHKSTRERTGPPKTQRKPTARAHAEPTSQAPASDSAASGPHPVVATAESITPTAARIPSHEIPDTMQASSSALTLGVAATAAHTTAVPASVEAKSTVGTAFASEPRSTAAPATTAFAPAKVVTPATPSSESLEPTPTSGGSREEKTDLVVRASEEPPPRREGLSRLLNGRASPPERRNAFTPRRDQEL